MTQHVIDYYQDGFAAIPFCKNCSAEGNALHDPCKPIVYDNVIIFQDMTRTEFEEKYQKALDQSKPKR
jgi:hypothetical protein